jgi:hypothetical protein
LVFALLAVTFPLLTASPAAAAPIGDDFNAPTLNAALWDEAGNTLGGAIFQYTGAQAALSVPSGTNSYQPWTSGNRAPTLRQSVADEDLDVVAAFGTIPSQKFQMQGIIIADGAGKFLRFDVHFDGAAMRAFAADPLVSTAALINVQLPNDSHAGFIRVTRTGNLFELLTSPNGSAWTSHGSFLRPMAVTELGPFVGNAKPNAGPAPEYSGLIDYFGPLPIPGNALGPADDNTVPDFDDLDITRAPNFISLDWSGDEPVTATATINGGQTQNSAQPFPMHDLHFTGLAPGTTYTVKMTITDLNGKVAVFTAPVATLGGGGGAGPTIDVWHGDGNTFGDLGTAQRWVNITGNVADPDGITALTYAVNGGAAKLAGLGQNQRRLVDPGDFNIDVEREDLIVGANRIVLTAFDKLGNASTRTVTFNLATGTRWPSAYGIDWSQVDSLEDHLDVVDGHWKVTPDGLRTAQVGYDRIVAFGDAGWADYEVLVPVTVHSIRTTQPGSPSGAPGVGVFLRWNGHNNTVTPGSQPSQGFLPEVGSTTPFGVLGFWRDRGAASEISVLNHRAAEVDDQPFSLKLDTAYYIRARVLGNTYSLKFWEATDAPDKGEPSAWTTKFTAGTTDRQPKGGSIGLVAHELDATFGDVIVTPWGPGKVVAPTFDPKAGQIDAGDAVDVIGTGKVDGQVHYTVDGSDPTPLSPTAEFGIPITESGTIVKAIEYRFGKRPSNVASATYTINEAPIVDAGPDGTVAAPDAFALLGAVTDDGIGNGALTTTWSKVSGPGTVTFEDAASTRTTVTFSSPGSYVLSLTGNDGSVARSDEITVFVRRDGYWLADASGQVFAFGTVQLFGDLSATSLSAPVSAMAARPTQDGYWITAANGLVQAYGNATQYGDVSDLTLNGPVVDIAATPLGDGYYLLGLDGGVFSFGNAPFFGSTGGLALDEPVQSMALTPSGNGYWFAAADGGMFAFGDAEFLGSVPGVLPAGVGVDKPIVGMAATPSGRGYWLVAADGGLFAFGDAGFYGSIPGVLPVGAKLDAPIVGMVATASGKGYWLVGADGGVFAFGDAPFVGSNGGVGGAAVVALAS